MWAGRALIAIPAYLSVPGGAGPGVSKQLTQHRLHLLQSGIGTNRSLLRCHCRDDRGITGNRILIRCR